MFVRKRTTSQPFVLETCFVGQVSWEIEEQVIQANQGVKVPVQVPINGRFVTPELRGPIISWARRSRVSCHNGICRTLSRFRDRFWWLSMRDYVTDYEATFPVCNQNKNQSPLSVGPFNLCQFHSAPGMTFHWILSPVCLSQMVTPWYLPLWTDSSRWCGLFRCQSCPPPKRGRRL